MNEKHIRFTLTDFKEQVSSVLQAVTHFNTSERSEACAYLQECINILVKGRNSFTEGSEVVQSSDTPELRKTEKICITYNKNYVNVEDTERRGESISNRCLKCDKVYENNTNLLERVTSHLGSPRSCKNCQNIFGNSSAYDYHIKLNLCQKIKKPDKRRNNCQVNQRSCCCNFTEHVDNHRCTDCKTCNAHFTDRKRLQVHSLEVHSVQLEDRIFRCYICNISFVNCNSLVHHYKLVHNCDDKVCVECGEFFSCANKLKDHKQKQHSMTQWDLNVRNNLPFHEEYATEDNIIEHENPGSPSVESHQLNTHHENVSNSLHRNTHEKVQFESLQDVKMLKSLKKEEMCVTYSRNDLDGEELENSENIIKKCSKCKKQFESSVFLLEHLMSYTGNPLSCRKCQTTFTNSTAFDYHVQMNLCHEIKRPDMMKKICQLCNKTFHSVSNFRKHIDGHKRNDCKICNAHFTNRKHLEAHSVEAHNTQLEKNHFRCHLCVKTFTHRRSLVHHYSLVHSDDGRVCSKCAKFFVDINEYKIHEHTHSLKQWVCERCNDKFSRRQQYLVHIQSHDRYHCVTCNESYAAKNKIIEHKRRGHSVRGLEPQHQCIQCGETFHSKSNLNSHAGCHNVEKNYTCVPCKKIFKKYSHYTRHQLSAAHINDQPPVDELLACSVCKKTFRYRHELVSHQKRVHKPEHKAQQCTFCNYKSTCDSNMKRHMALHTQKQQFICEKCGSSFYTKNSLKEHDKCIHSDERNYSCDKCGRAFKLISSLNRHMLTHSEERPKVCHCGNSYKFACNLRHHQLLVHGKVDSVKKIKRLYKDETIPDKTQNKVKKKVKLKHTEDSSDPIISVMNSQVVTIPSSSLSISTSSTSMSQNTLVLMTDRHESHLLQVPYQNVSFPPESKSHILYTQPLDINLQVAESMLHLGNKTIKSDQNVLINPSSHSNIFTRSITDSDSSYIPSEEIIHPSVQPSLISSLEESLPGSVDQSGPKQTLMTSLPDYIPHNFSFLNV